MTKADLITELRCQNHDSLRMLRRYLDDMQHNIDWYRRQLETDTVEPTMPCDIGEKSTRNLAHGIDYLGGLVAYNNGLLRRLRQPRARKAKCKKT